MTVRLRAVPHERHSASAPFALALALALFACDSDLTREQRVERANVVSAIQNLQRADTAEKQRALDDLTHTACSSAAACAARDTCARAYEALVNSQQAARRARSLLDTDAVAAAAATRDAESDAHRFNMEAARCLRARHRLDAQGD